LELGDVKKGSGGMRCVLEPAENIAYIVNNFTIPAGRDMSTEVDLVGVRRKPLQHRLEMDYEGMLLLIQSRVLPRV
jgi:hypothetical protein